MAVRTTVKIDGDSSDAVAAVRTLGASFRAASAPVNEFAATSLKMTAGVLGAESAMAGLRIVVHSLAESVRAYSATNDEAASAFAALDGRVKAARISIGEMIAGGGNAQVMAGALTESIDALTVSLGGMVGAQQAVRSGLALLMDGMGIAAETLALLRGMWGGLQIAIITAERAQQSLAAGTTALGLTLIDALVAPVDLVVSGLRTMVEAMGSIPGVNLGGAVESLRGLETGVDGARERIQALRDTMARGVTQAWDGYRADVDASAEATVAAVSRIGELGARMHETADAVRAGTITIDAATVSLGGMATAAKEASGALVALSDVQIKAKLVIAPDLSGDARKAAAALEAQKALDFAAGEAMRAAAAEAAAERIRLAAEAEQAAMERRAEVMRSTGAAFGEALAVGVSAQRDATRSIVSIIIRETQARIAAALAQSAILAATPGGQFAAAAIGAAVAFASSQLQQIGGAGGGRGGGGAVQQTINVTVTGGGASDDEFLRRVTDAVATGARRGAMA